MCISVAVIRPPLMPPTYMATNMTADPIDMLVGFSNFEASRALTHWVWALGRRGVAFVTRPAAHSDRARDGGAAISPR